MNVASSGRTPLLSTSSAAGCPALFGRFFDTMGLSDSSSLFIVGYAFRLPSAPQIAFDRGEAGGLPDSSNVCPHMHGVSDPGWPQPVSHTDVLNVAFRLPRRRRHHRLEGFRGSTPSLCVPLSTLRLQPHDRRRMTRGRGGLLSLPPMALSSTTLCLLTGAFRGFHPLGIDVQRVFERAQQTAYGGRTDCVARRFQLGTQCA